jgi:hypothetical protein
MYVLRTYVPQCGCAVHTWTTVLFGTGCICESCVVCCAVLCCVLCAMLFDLWRTLCSALRVMLCAVLCYVSLCLVRLCFLLFHYAEPSWALLCFFVSYHAVLCSVWLCSAVLCCAVLCACGCSVLCFDLLRDALPCCDLLCFCVLSCDGICPPLHCDLSIELCSAELCTVLSLSSHALPNCALWFELHFPMCIYALRCTLLCYVVLCITVFNYAQPHCAFSI